MTTNWRLDRQRRDDAARLGEAVARELGVAVPPVDPFLVLKYERRRLRAFGDDFGDAFDGRLEYQRPRFLLFYNTKYDAEPHLGGHHPKVYFTVAHELGHYFLDRHRNYLRKGGGPHGSLTEFVSANQLEREADSFAAGLLTPDYLAEPLVNAAPPTLQAVRQAQEQFGVSLTSMLVRWIQLSRFPCALAVVQEGDLQWGVVSEPFHNLGGGCFREGTRLAPGSARQFLEAESSLTTHREGEGRGSAARWLDCGGDDLEFHEDYVVLPKSRQLLIFLTADAKAGDVA